MQIVYEMMVGFSKEVEEAMAKNGWPSHRVHFADEVVHYMHKFIYILLLIFFDIML